MDLMVDDTYALSIPGLLYTIGSAVFVCSYVDETTNMIYHKFNHAVAHRNHDKFINIWSSITTHKKIHEIAKLHIYETCVLDDVENNKIIITPLPGSMKNIISIDSLCTAGHKSKDMLVFIFHEYMSFRIYTISFHKYREEDDTVPIKVFFQGGSEFVYVPATINNVQRNWIIGKKDFDEFEVDWMNYLHRTKSAYSGLK